VEKGWQGLQARVMELPSGPKVIMMAGKKHIAHTKDQKMTKKMKPPYVEKKLKEQTKSIIDAISVEIAPESTDTPMVVKD